ncbi:MAG TPA: DUF2934 domain-containing protein [Gemmatimonadaceae bacterium]
MREQRPKRNSMRVSRDTAKAMETPAPVNGSTRTEAGAPVMNLDDRIRLRAYDLYMARGGTDGGALDDWLAAEREIGEQRVSGA